MRGCKSHEKKEQSQKEGTGKKKRTYKEVEEQEGKEDKWVKEGIKE